MNQHERAIEMAAVAMKEAMGIQLMARPLHGDVKSTDWHATGGSIDLSKLAAIAINEYLRAFGVQKE